MEALKDPHNKAREEKRDTKLPMGTGQYRIAARTTRISIQGAVHGPVAFLIGSGAGRPSEAMVPSCLKMLQVRIGRQPLRKAFQIDFVS